MKTKVISLYPDFDIDKLEFVAAAILHGKLVAFPTETVYGLGANALLPQAINSVFKVKKRPQDNPLIVHLSQIEQLDQVAKNIPDIAYKILAAFAPGPLTIILEKNEVIPNVVSRGLATVAIRFPSNKIAKTLIELAGVPIVAPSANISGKPSPTKAWHVYQDLNGKIPYILDGGTCEYGLESSIVDLSTKQAEILRPGLISAKDIYQKTGISVLEYQAKSHHSLSPKAPGQKYRHYSPAGTVMVLKEHPDLDQRMVNLQKGILDFIKRSETTIYEKYKLNQAIKIGLFVSLDVKRKFQENNLSLILQEKANEIFTKQSPEKKEKSLHIDFQLVSYENREGALEAARDLYNQFREFDSTKTDLIVCSAEPQLESGIAYMNRLGKAATFEV